MSDEITVTLTSLENQTTESISVSLNSTKLSELCEWAVALLGLPTSVDIVLTKDIAEFQSVATLAMDVQHGAALAMPCSADPRRIKGYCTDKGRPRDCHKTHYCFGSLTCCMNQSKQASKQRTTAAESNKDPKSLQQRLYTTMK